MQADAPATPRLHRLVRLAAILALAVAALVWPLSAWLTGQAQTVWFVHAADEATQAVNRFTFEEDQQADPVIGDVLRERVIALYGTRSGAEAEASLFLDEARLMRPPEMDGLVLYDVRAGKPLQAQTVSWATRWVSLGAAVTGLALLGLSFWLRRRASR